MGFTAYDDNSVPVGATIEDSDSTGNIEGLNKEEHGVRWIQLFYTTTDVKVSRTSLRVDFNTFISNVGGSLGLFIGFSVLGVFYFIYDVISSEFN